MKKLLNIGYSFFIAAVVALGVLLIGSAVPIPGNFDLKIVLSGSMEPAIPVGSLVVIKPSADYAVGDVITFGRDTRIEVPTTHRVVASRAVAGDMRYTTKGDANDEQDGREVLASEVIGEVLFDVPYLGYILDMGRKPWGMALLIGIPAAVIVGDEVRKIVAEVKRMKSAKTKAQTGTELRDAGTPGPESAA